MYYVFKSIRIIKKYWWTLILSWPDKVQRIFSTAHEFSFKKETKPQLTTCFNYANVMTLTLLYIFYQMLKFETPCLLSYFISVFIFLTGIQLAHTCLLLNPCRFVSVLIPVRGELEAHFKILKFKQYIYTLDIDWIVSFFSIMLFISNVYLYMFCIIFLSFSYFNSGMYIFIMMLRQDRKSTAIFFSSLSIS